MTASGGSDVNRAARRPIFIQGMLGRSGTNYLARLLDLHPHCRLSTIPEDWLLAESHHLMQYASAVSARWRREPAWDLPPDLEAGLVSRLGEGMLALLNDGMEGQRVVTKTPNVQWLGNFFQLFSEASLLVLVRDGRSVAESARRSFGDDPSQVARWWAWAARQVLTFDRANRDRRHYRLVRYEDLVNDPEAEMAAILKTVELDAGAYDFARIRSLPVFGSSTCRNEAGEWEWRIAPATAGGVRVDRWRDWSRGDHERFNWIAGEALRELGYEPEHLGGQRLSRSLRTVLWATLDGLRRARTRLRSATGERTALKWGPRR